MFRVIRAALVATRKEDGLSQTEVGQRIGQRQTFVSNYELGERRLDVVEFVMIAEAIGADPITVLRKVAGGRRDRINTARSRPSRV